jgi:phenylpyruvate tautomerase PptA (4-oxalocrotonate tautomerase family)
MPLVTISVRRGRSEQEKQAISEAVHRSLVEEIGIPDGDFNHRILDLDEADWHLPAGRSERMVCVEIRMYPGRTAEMKRALFRSIARKLEALGMAAEDAFVVIDEPPRENWSVSAAADVKEKAR